MKFAIIKVHSILSRKMSLSIIFGLVIPYLDIDGLTFLLQSHKYDVDNKIILKNHCISLNLNIPQEFSYYEFYNYIKFYYLLSHFSTIGQTKRKFVMNYYLHVNPMFPYTKLKDPRGSSPGRSYYYCYIRARWVKYSNIFY